MVDRGFRGLTVHLVPYSHNDLGWRKTVDHYYYGTNKQVQRASVMQILETVTIELEKDPNRK